MMLHEFWIEEEKEAFLGTAPPGKRRDEGPDQLGLRMSSMPVCVCAGVNG